MAHVRLRYWASLKAAAGAQDFETEAATLAEALNAARFEYGDSSQFAKILQICSVVIDGVPVGLRNHNEISVTDGAVIDLLPPFAGG